MQTLRRPSLVLAAAGLLLAPAHGGSAFEPGTTSNPSGPRLLVKNAVWNELQTHQHPKAYFEYRETDESPGQSSLSTEIETPQGVVASEMEDNGHPLTDEQRSRDAQQLQKLVRSPKARRQLLQSQQDEDRRRMELLKQFPAAFLFQFEGREADGVVRLKFRPDPRFQPPSKQDLILRGMTGTIQIDSRRQRLVEIDGTLTRDVTLGWGVVVRLYRGGHFVMKEAEVGPGCWRTTLLAVDLDGKIFLVKSLKVRLKQVCENFKQVAKNLTVPQAVTMLRARQNKSGQGAVD